MLQQMKRYGVASVFQQEGNREKLKKGLKRDEGELHADI